MSDTPKPDYGEPWKVGRIDRPIEDRHGHDPLMLHRTASRAVFCVNACAGMTDPAEEIANLKMELDASCNAEHLRQVRDENKAIKRAIQTAYESLEGLDLHLPKNYGLLLLLALEKLQPFTTP
jgi:hypothetical protein